MRLAVDGQKDVPVDGLPGDDLFIGIVGVGRLGRRSAPELLDNLPRDNIAVAVLRRDAPPQRRVAVLLVIARVRRREGQYPLPRLASRRLPEDMHLDVALPVGQRVRRRREPPGAEGEVRLGVERLLAAGDQRPDVPVVCVVGAGVVEQRIVEVRARLRLGQSPQVGVVVQASGIDLVPAPVRGLVLVRVGAPQGHRLNEVLPLGPNRTELGDGLDVVVPARRVIPLGGRVVGEPLGVYLGEVVNEREVQQAPEAAVLNDAVRIGAVDQDAAGAVGVAHRLVALPRASDRVTVRLCAVTGHSTCGRAGGQAGRSR